MRIQKTPRAVVRILIVLGLALLTGCGTRTLNMNLIYPPEQGATEIPQSPMIETAGYMSPGDIVLEIFDARADKDLLGVDRDIFGMTLANVASDDNVAVWVNDAMTYELTKAGYNVLQKGSESTNDIAIGLIVDIQKIHCDTHLIFYAEVLLQVTLDNANKRQVTNQYEGKGNAGDNWFTTRKRVRASLALALQDAISKMLADFDLAEQP